ncbi:hypothetical protein BC629DRAFT_1539625 [Irpex lacteus]|nr:hypothetical protein BC629DRAFT_1539625 [Irpex lacteus]
MIVLWRLLNLDATLTGLSTTIALTWTTMAQSRMPTSYLDRLPLELISMIFKNLGYDLVAHVTFSILRSDIYDFCYSSLDAEFWQRILRASGLATLNLAEGNIECQTRDEWELLARECVLHAEVCTHPKCGMVRIRQNEEAVRKSLNHDVDLMHTFSTDNPNDTATLQELHILEFSPVWDGIAFKKARAGPTKTWQSAAFVRPAEDDSEDDTEDDAEDDDTLQYGDELVEHPVLWRSFATFPPVTDFTVLLHEDARMEPYNSDGVIVADVLQNILDMYVLLIIMMSVADCNHINCGTQR